MIRGSCLFLAVTFLLGFPWPAFAQTGPTLGQFRLYYSPVQDGKKTPLDHWLLGYSDAIGVFYVTSKMDRSPTPFCLPDRYDLKDKLPALVQQYLVEYQAGTGYQISDDAPLSGVAFAALTGSFPCKQIKK